MKTVQFAIIVIAFLIVCFMAGFQYQMAYDKGYIEGVKDGRDQILTIADECIDMTDDPLHAWSSFTDVCRMLGEKEKNEHI